MTIEALDKQGTKQTCCLWTSGSLLQGGLTQGSKMSNSITDELLRYLQHGFLCRQVWSYFAQCTKVKLSHHFGARHGALLIFCWNISPIFYSEWLQTCVTHQTSTSLFKKNNLYDQNYMLVQKQCYKIRIYLKLVE